MTDTTGDQSPLSAKTAEAKLTFSFPDVITVSHYETYTGARLKFADEYSGPVSSVRAQYEGARALIAAGVVHLSITLPAAEGESPAATDAELATLEAKLREIINNPDQSLTPAAIMVLIGTTVAAKIEQDMINPFLSGALLKVSMGKAALPKS